MREPVAIPPLTVSEAQLAGPPFCCLCQGTPSRLAVHAHIGVYTLFRCSTSCATATIAAMAAMVYECPECEARLLGERRCVDCGLFARRIGPGGECPHCGEPVAVTELIAGEGIAQ